MEIFFTRFFFVGNLILFSDFGFGKGFRSFQLGNFDGIER